MEQFFQNTTANHSALGLWGFGITTILLNIHNARFFEINCLIMGMGIFFGGIQQVIAEIKEWKKDNDLGMSAFTSFGFFWLTLVAFWLLPPMGVAKPDGAAIGCYLGIWGLFTLAFFIGTLNKNSIGKLIFGSLVILFALFYAASFTGSESINTFAGYEGILCVFFAFHERAAIVISRKKSLPL